MDFWLYMISLASIFLLFTLGYNLILGKGKILHFGYQGHNLLVVYVFWILVTKYQVHMLFAAPIGLTVSVLLGLLLSWLSLRLEDDAFGVMSIALHLVVFAIVLNWQDMTKGALGIASIPRLGILQSPIAFTITCVLCAFFWALIMLWFEKSKHGRALQALSEGEWYAQSLGISKVYTRHITFALCSVGIFIAGFLYPQFIYLLTPNDYHFPGMIFYVMVVIAGGSGRIWGVIIATIALVFLRDGLRFVGLPPDLIGPIRLMLFGLILFIAVTLRRNSLFPQKRSV